LGNGKYTVTPSRSGYAFSPASQSANINGANITGLNFVANAAAAVAPTITTQPANQTVTAGQTTTFTVVATGTATLSYQWQKNGVNIAGASLASYTTPATSTSDSGAQLTAMVSNTAGSVTSGPATLTVTAAAVAPSITAQPASQTVTAGQTAPFSVAATGTAPLSYQWSKNGTAISGATASSYTTQATSTSDNGAQFTAVVSNTAGRVTSSAATLTVTAASGGSLTIANTSLAGGQVGQLYSVTLQAAGGTPSYSWSITSGQLPAGLALGAASGQISGTPSASGQFNFTAQVTDTASPPATVAKALTLLVSTLPAMDQYGGLLSAPSPNGGTGFFRVEKNNGRWALITPAGNMTWYRGVQNAESNTINGAVLTSKYGGDVYSWGRDRNRRLTGWNFNILGEETACSELPFGCYGGGASNSPKLSYLLLTPVSLDCVLNPGGVAITLPDNCKSIAAGTVCSDCSGWKMIDPWEPRWQQGVANEFNYYVDKVIQNAVTQPWLVGWSLDDADYTQLFKAQGTGVLTGGYANAAYIIAATNFDYSSVPHPGGGSWLDPKLYGKYAWITFLKGRYANIGALNTAWGTGGFYTSFDDVGGFGTGTGVIDEDGRHTAWMGTSPRTLAGASAGVVTDLNEFLYQFTLKYSQVVVSTIRARDTNHLIFAPDFTSPYGEGMRSEVVRGFKDGGFNVLVLNYDPNFSSLAGNMVNNNAIYDLAQLPAILWYSIGAQADSGQSALPVPYGDPNFASQSARGAQMLNTDIPNFLNAAGTVNPDKYIIGIDWWVGDGTGDTFNWGLWSRLDNAYDGVEAVSASVPCDQGETENRTNCGGQAANYGDFITSLKAANLLWTKVYP